MSARSNAGIDQHFCRWITLGGTLAPFNVVVTCTSVPFTEGAVGPTIYIYDYQFDRYRRERGQPGRHQLCGARITVKMGR